jgi:succinate dehydrogenase flavin-adding protein (antitoxin of CptAB toxin-antitoxin module)
LSFLDLLEKDDVDLIDWLLNGMPVPEDLNNIVAQIKHNLNHEEK